MRVPLSDGAEAVFTDHDNGQTSGLPVVLLHGLTQQQHYWGPVLARLAGRRVITVDQRGHGEASGSQVTPQSDFSIPRLAQDVIGLDQEAWHNLPNHPSVIWRHVARDAQPLLEASP